MKIKSLVLICLASLSFGLASAESARDYVCVVRSNLPEKTVAFLQEYHDVILGAGYESYAEEIDDYIKEGTFGSGFTIRAADGKMYVITNGHVVEDAASVNLSFENEDGSYSEYKDLKILAADEDIDVALIEVPEGFSRRALSFSGGSVNDGDEVWAAGFPSLNGKPMWQFSRGTVTNNRAKIDELLSSDISTLIQHSADIDSGNSGGPLLMADSSNPGTYTVVGINTWKAVSREGTNFAIPSKVIETFVTETVMGTKKSVGIDERIKQFVEALKDEDKGFLAISKFVSNEMISKVGDEAFLLAVRSSSGSTQDAIISLYAYSPVSGMKYSIAYVIWSDFQKNGKTLEVTYSEPVADGENWTVGLTPQGKKELTSVWGEEQGMLRMVEYSSIKSKGTSIWGRGHEGFDLYSPFLLEVRGSFLYPFETKKGGFDAGVVINMTDWTAVSVGFTSETVRMPISDGYIEEKDTKRSTFYMGFGLQVPIFVNSFIIVPHADVRTGFSNFGDLDSTGMMLGFGGGLKFGYIINSVCPVITVDYMHSIYSYLGNHDDSWDSNSLRVGAGIQIVLR